MSKTRNTYRVKDVAGLSGVSVRTLHHYDEIGLLTPKQRSAGGYRLYSDGDLLRLQQILVGRALGLSLEEIRRSLDDPRFDRRKTLLAQREALRNRVHETERMIKAIDAALAATKTTNRRGTMNFKELFDGFDPSVYEDEVKARWGKSDAYKESAKRTSKYTKADWQAIKAEQVAIYSDAVALMKAGKKPTDKESMNVAERHRFSIERWFYPCSRFMHSGLASMYESDERFSQNIDKHGDGLTTFLVAAIRANAAQFSK
jgi:DNA-binding transcriptional MerR regulator